MPEPLYNCLALTCMSLHEEFLRNDEASNVSPTDPYIVCSIDPIISKVPSIGI